MTGWLTPGGGVEPGESLVGAAVRELWEEVGLAVVPGQLGVPVAATAGWAEIGGVAGVFRDDFFVLRVRGHAVEWTGLDPHERRELTGHRWWPLDEIESTRELVYPCGLASLLRDLRSDARPRPEVRELPWRHPT